MENSGAGVSKPAVPGGQIDSGQMEMGVRRRLRDKRSDDFAYQEDAREPAKIVEVGAHKEAPLLPEVPQLMDLDESADDETDDVEILITTDESSSENEFMSDDEYRIHFTVEDGWGVKGKGQAEQSKSNTGKWKELSRLRLAILGGRRSGGTSASASGSASASALGSASARASSSTTVRPPIGPHETNVTSTSSGGFTHSTDESRMRDDESMESGGTSASASGSASASALGSASARASSSTTVRPPIGPHETNVTSTSSGGFTHSTDESRMRDDESMELDESMEHNHDDAMDHGPSVAYFDRSGSVLFTEEGARIICSTF
ncbi:unnamed protein product [Cuscuta campestris]|uniref:Uncharacterized protein n=1 Tax=Cuscuta campestris TaxID=132261 RepID=A0A484K2G2_9ASTE|nr:unnamed protein product [Cuscuta campestris]